MVKEDVITRLNKTATQLRKDVVLMIGGEGHVGHLGGSCSSADIIAALYFHKMKVDPKNPNWEDRDKLLMSKGHAVIIQYAALAELGYFSKDLLPTLKSFGSILQGHPDRLKTPGIEVGTGSLGQGLSIANGMALAAKLDKKDTKVYCILGDGELAEGQVWEAAMTSANYKLDNLVAIVDKNGLQATGAIEERFNIGSVSDKFSAFGWHVIEIDGHNMEEIIDALDAADEVKGKPVVIIARTIKGKGVSFAENNVAFHNGPLTKEQYELALKELDAELEKYN